MYQKLRKAITDHRGFDEPLEGFFSLFWTTKIFITCSSFLMFFLTKQNWPSYLQFPLKLNRQWSNCNAGLFSINPLMDTLCRKSPSVRGSGGGVHTKDVSVETKCQSPTQRKTIGICFPGTNFQVEMGKGRESTTQGLYNYPPEKTHGQDLLKQ